MATFDISKYMSHDEEESLKQTKKVEEEKLKGKGKEKYLREIKVGKIEDKALSVSEVIFKMLQDVLVKEDFTLTDRPDDKEYHVFKNVNVVSSEDINHNLTESLKLANGSDALILSMEEAKTPQEKIFLNELNREMSIYKDVDSFMKDLKGV